MLKSVRLQNDRGNTLELVGSEKYSLTNITGLNPVAAAINTTTNGIHDGSRYNSSKLGSRNIVITVSMEEPVEKNRLELYQYIRPKHDVTFYYENGKRNVYIPGWVETCELNPFSQKIEVQISIICPKPYFHDMEQSYEEIRGIAKLFEFPASIPKEGVALSEILTKHSEYIKNAGDVETGGIFVLETSGIVINPVIRNIDTMESFSLQTTLVKGDILKINTLESEKSVTLQREGKDINMINYINDDSVWLQIPIGSYRFGLYPEYGFENAALKIIHENLYTGV